jgi:hypothetical protein
VKQLFSILLLIAGCVAAESCGQLAEKSNATRCAKVHGFTKFKVLDQYSAFIGLRGCGAMDFAMFPMSGVNPIGEQVTFFVCTGIFKGSTLRTE